MIALGNFSKGLVIVFEIFEDIDDGLIRHFFIIRNEGIRFHMSSTAFRTDESSLMIDDNTVLMSINRVNDLFSPVLLDVGMEGTTITKTASILDADLFINDTTCFKFVI